MYDYKNVNFNNPVEREEFIKEAVDELKRSRKRVTRNKIFAIGFGVYGAVMAVVGLASGAELKIVFGLLGAGAFFALFFSWTVKKAKREAEEFEKSLKNFMTPQEAIAYDVK